MPSMDFCRSFLKAILPLFSFSIGEVSGNLLSCVGRLRDVPGRGVTCQPPENPGKGGEFPEEAAPPEQYFLSQDLAG